jgi:hypothetical protein
MVFSCLQNCSSVPKQELLTKATWRLQGVVSRPLVASKKDSIPAEPLQREKVQITYQFQKDKKYIFLRGSQKDVGDWGMSSDEKVLLLRSHTSGNENAEFRIHSLNESRLIVSTEHKDKQEILYFAISE